jgi:lipase maturation factor 1
MNLRAIANRLNSGSFELTEALFLRLLGLTYLCAFGSLWPQILGLTGSHGVAPAANLMTAMRAQLGARAFFYTPSLLWLNASDNALTLFCGLGCACGMLLLAGLLSRWMAAACFLLYLSIVTVGQPFTSFQWDALLLEAGFLAILAGAPWLAWTYRLLLFRLMFESGLVKLTSGDPNWRNLHALRFHFMTQPLPNPIAYYMDRAPNWLLDSLCAITIAIELLAPFLLFFPRRWRIAGVAALMLLQVAILLTGNYAFFNLLALALCLWGLDDATFAPLGRLLRRRFPSGNIPKSKPVLTAMNTALALIALLGVLELFGHAPAFVQPFEIVNGYGLFANMTTSRPEIVIEGSDDSVNWKEYSFRYKPGNLHRGLPLVAPYQPRLDWQMWFAALGRYEGNSWVGSLMYRLLLGDSSVAALMDSSPFAKPPRYVRALIYEYDFTTLAERARSGAIWQRRLLGTWFGPVALKR